MCLMSGTSQHTVHPLSSIHCPAVIVSCLSAQMPFGGFNPQGGQQQQQQDQQQQAAGNNGGSSGGGKQMLSMMESMMKVLNV